MRNNKGFGLIEMMVSLVIVMLLAYLYMKFAWKDSGVSQQTKKALAEDGIKTNNPQGMVQQAQDTVNQLNKKIAADQKEMDSYKNK